MARGGINKALVTKAYEALIARAGKTPRSTLFALNWETPALKPPFSGMSRKSSMKPLHARIEKRC